MNDVQMGRAGEHCYHKGCRSLEKLLGERSARPRSLSRRPVGERTGAEGHSLLESRLPATVSTVVIRHPTVSPGLAVLDWDVR
jgi:hypothetical protein